MLAAFPAPVLSVAADAVRELEGGEALSGLWTLFTKCKESLQDGRRLENISWRLWYREMVVAPVTASQHQHHQHHLNEKDFNEGEALHAENPPSYRPPTPDDSSSPAPRSHQREAHFQPPYYSNIASSYASSTASSYSMHSPASHRPAVLIVPSSPARIRRGSTVSVGKIICDMLPNPVPPSSHPRTSPAPSLNSPSFSSLPPFAQALLPPSPYSLTASPSSAHPPAPISHPTRCPMPHGAPAVMESLYPTPAAELGEPESHPHLSSDISGPNTSLSQISSSERACGESRDAVSAGTPPVSGAVSTPSRGGAPSFSHLQSEVDSSGTSEIAGVLTPLHCDTTAQSVSASSVSLGQGAAGPEVIISPIPTSPRSSQRSSNTPRTPTSAGALVLTSLPLQVIVVNPTPNRTPHPTPPTTPTLLPPVPDGLPGIPPGVTSVGVASTSFLSPQPLLNVPGAGPAKSFTPTHRTTQPHRVSSQQSREVRPPLVVDIRDPYSHLQYQQQPQQADIAEEGEEPPPLSPVPSQTSTLAPSVTSYGDPEKVKGIVHGDLGEMDGSVRSLESIGGITRGGSLKLRGGMASPPPPARGHAVKACKVGTKSNRSSINGASSLSPTKPLRPLAGVGGGLQRSTSSGSSSGRSRTGRTGRAQALTQAQTQVKAAGKKEKEEEAVVPRGAATSQTRSERSSSRNGKNHSRSRSRGDGSAPLGGGGGLGMGMLAMTRTESAGGGSRKVGGRGRVSNGRLGAGLRSGGGGRGGPVRKGSTGEAVKDLEDANEKMQEKERENEREREGKRPRFNIGSHSDEGSGIGSKSAGSGSSASGLSGGLLGVGPDLNGIAAGQLAGISAMARGVAGPIGAPTKGLTDVKGKARDVSSNEVQKSTTSVDPKLGLPSKQAPVTAPALPAPSNFKALPSPNTVLPQRKTTIVLATSESDYETDTEDEDDSWSSEAMSTNLSEKHHDPPKHQRQSSNGNSSNARSKHSAPHHVDPHHTQHNHANQSRHARSGSNNKSSQQALLVEKAAMEAQRQRDMFAKVPTTTNLRNARTRSVGLLSQLMNPDPQIFPVNHPYRRGFSYGEIRNGNVGTQQATFRQDQPQPSRVPAQQQAAYAGPRAPGLQMSKSSAALPVSSQVQAVNVGESSGGGGSGGMNGSGYRPKGRPQGQEMEDDSDSDGEEGGIQLSKSVAHEKLKALADKQRISGSKRISGGQAIPPQPDIDDVPIWARGTANVPYQTVAPATVQHVPGANHHHPAPIPVGHPYNLPPPAPPSTPRTTRRLMLQTEMSESLRRNLLWERQVSKVNLIGFRRAVSNGNPANAGDGGGGNPGNGHGLAGRPGNVLSGALRPLTTTPSMVQLSAKTGNTSGNGGAGDKERDRRGSGGADIAPGHDQQREEMKQKAMARNRSWADDYHFRGW